jgi:hypothetical protein
VQGNRKVIWQDLGRIGRDKFFSAQLIQRFVGIPGRDIVFGFNSAAM